MTTPRYLGAHTAVPQPPDGHGALLLTSWFTSTVEIFVNGAMVHDRPNYDIWIPPPSLRLDGAQAEVGWAPWWYPLSAGPHRVEITTPGPAMLDVEIAEGAVVALAYRADIRIRKDSTDGVVLEWAGTATLQHPRGVIGLVG